MYSSRMPPLVVGAEPKDEPPMGGRTAEPNPDDEALGLLLLNPLVLPHGDVPNCEKGELE